MPYLSQHYEYTLNQQALEFSFGDFMVSPSFCQQDKIYSVLINGEVPDADSFLSFDETNRVFSVFSSSESHIGNH